MALTAVQGMNCKRTREEADTYKEPWVVYQERDDDNWDREVIVEISQSR